MVLHDICRGPDLSVIHVMMKNCFQMTLTDGKEGTLVGSYLYLKNRDERQQLSVKLRYDI